MISQGNWLSHCRGLIISNYHLIIKSLFSYQHFPVQKYLDRHTILSKLSEIRNCSLGRPINSRKVKIHRKKFSVHVFIYTQYNFERIIFVCLSSDFTGRLTILQSCQAVHQGRQGDRCTRERIYRWQKIKIKKKPSTETRCKNSRTLRMREIWWGHIYIVSDKILTCDFLNFWTVLCW